MTEQEIRDKLHESTVLLKLVSGELLVAIMISKSEYGVTIFLPFELKNNELLDYCDIYTTDSKFDLFATNVLFIKRPNEEIRSQYFNFVIRDRADELRSFILAMSLLQNTASTIATTLSETSSKTIH